MNKTEIIRELEKRSNEYMKHYKETDDIQSQCVALGLDEALQVIRRIEVLE